MISTVDIELVSKGFSPRKVEDMATERLAGINWHEACRADTVLLEWEELSDLLGKYRKDLTHANRWRIMADICKDITSGYYPFIGFHYHLMQILEFTSDGDKTIIFETKFFNSPLSEEVLDDSNGVMKIY